MKKKEHSEGNAKKRFSGSDAVILASVALVILVTVYSALIISSSLSGLGEAIANMTGGVNATDGEGLPKISILMLVAPDCADCLDPSGFVESVNQSSELSYSQFEYGSQEAGDAISKYGIKKLPALVISGEIDKSETVERLLSASREAGDARVIDAPAPPYYSVEQARIVGRIEATVVNVGICDGCLPAVMITEQLREIGVVFSGISQHEYGSAEASEAIAKYGLDKLPALVLSADFGEYKELLQIPEFGEIFSEESDGSFVFRRYNYPYLEAGTGIMRGRVDIVLIDDEACGPCYDPELHANAVVAYGVSVNSTAKYDISSPEGSALVQKYNITKVPTMVLSPEASVYPVFMEIWPEVGTVESDGWLVFRNIDATGGSYKDLETGIIIIKEEG